MSAVATETLFLRDPAAWVAEPGCVCRSAGVGLVHDVDKVPVVYAAGGGGAIPGLTPDETAILAGVLTGLALFLLLLLPILCCLCPLPCACCGLGKKKAAKAGGHGHRNMARSDNESFWSTGSWGAGDKTDYQNLYGVDMKLPRPWVDSGSHFDNRMHDMEDGGWEGVDMTRDEIDAAVRSGGAGGGGEEAMAQSGIVTYASGEQAGAGAGGGGAQYSTIDRSRSGADETITEYTTTRRMDMHVGGLNQQEAENYYSRNYGEGHYHWVGTYTGYWPSVSQENRETWPPEGGHVSLFSWLTDGQYPVYVPTQWLCSANYTHIPAPDYRDHTGTGL